MGAGIRLFVIFVINLIPLQLFISALRDRLAMGTCVWPLFGTMGSPIWKSRKLRQVPLGVLFLGMLILWFWNTQ